jgi:hypothetical protein
MVRKMQENAEQKKKHTSGQKRVRIYEQSPLQGFLLGQHPRTETLA